MVVIDVPRRAERRSALLFLMPILVLGFLWVASGIAVPPWLAPRSAQLQGLVTTFLGIFIEALPFLLAGVVTSILIGAFVTPAWLASVLPRSAFGATVSGALLGLLFPVCECGAIPTSRRLMRKGAPASLGIAFALAAPVVNPIVLISTTVAFGDWRWAAARLGFTVVIAVIIGLLLGVGIKREDVLTAATLQPDADEVFSTDDKLIAHQQQRHEQHHDHNHQPGGLWRERAGAMLGHGSVEFFEMGRFLVLGSLLAATMQTFISQGALLAFNGSSFGFAAPLFSIGILMLVAVLLSVCSTVDAFLALAFLGLFHPGAVMAFLVFGPMIDIKSTLMLTTTFRKTTVSAMVVLAAVFSIIAGLITYVVLK